MVIYVAPPRGKGEREAIQKWLTYFNYEIVWLDLRRKVKGPLLLCGGADIGKDEERDSREFIWIKQALDSNNRILGICRGMQILNHYFGGKVEDLSEAIVEDHKAADFSEDIDHSGKPSQFHNIEDLDGKITRVNSRHHQHCNILANNFKATHLSYPTYGVVEGFEDLDKMIWGVQWHPEKMESEDNEYPLGKLSQKFF